MPRTSLHIFALLFSTTLGLQANEVLLRSTPDLDAPVVQRVRQSDPIVQKAITITNSGLAQRGWMRTSTLMSFEGYLSTEDLSKNFEIELKAKVHPSAELAGPALTNIERSDQIEVLKVDDAWAKIRISKAMPAYFQIGAQKEPTPIYVPPVRSTQPAQRQFQATAEFNPSLSVGSTRPGALPPENVVWSGTSTPVTHTPATRAPAKQTAAPTASPLAQIDHSQSTPRIKPDGRIYRLNGTLVRAVSSEAPRYTLRLEDNSGESIAYVDASHMYIEDMRPYLNQTVYIHGEVHPIEPNSPTLIIIARTIRVGE